MKRNHKKKASRTVEHKERALVEGKVENLMQREMDERVILLYEQTRDGITTPDDYKKELLSPEVPIGEIEKAIRLGTQEWIETSRSKEL